MTANFDIVAPHEGTTSNRYRMLGRLAGGGMADIFLARSTSIAGVARHVVLKRVLAEHGRDPQFTKMFLDEARLVAQLQHPNIAQVHDVGMIDGSYFFTMEFVHGKDLRALLQTLATEKRRLPLNIVLHIVSGALAALHHAHELTSATGLPLGIVHRDVSPSNVMVSYEGTIKLLDFGVAKAAENTEKTRPGMLKGKVSYFSPEQCRTAAVDRRSDLYSIGILLHELLTCRRLYKHESDFETMNAIVTQPPIPPSHFRADIPPRLEAVVQKALQKDPDRRFATAAEMIEEIEEIAAEHHLRLSASATAKFVRELFGDRKEPWKELAGDAEISITFHGDPLLAIGSSPDQEAAIKPETRAELPPLPGVLALMRPRRLQRQRRLIALALGALAISIGVVLAGLSRPTAAKSAEQLAPTTTAETRTATGVGVKQELPARQNVPGKRSTSTNPSAPVAAARTLATAMHAGDWIGALQVCVALAAPTTNDRTSCAIAACNAGQRGVAFDHYAGAPTAARPAIERACRVAGIALRSPVRAARPKADPCELDPLQCQK